MAFANLKYLETLKLPNSLEKVGDAICRGTNVTKLNLGENVKEICMPDQWSNISEIEIDEKNPYLTCENNVIYNKEKTILIRVIHTKQDSFKVEEGITEIRYLAFYGSTLNNIILPNTLKKLNGINLVSNLTKIEIPSSVEEIEKTCFSECSSLSEVIIHKPKDSIKGAPWSTPLGNRAIIWEE